MHLTNHEERQAKSIFLSWSQFSIPFDNEPFHKEHNISAEMKKTFLEHENATVDFLDGFNLFCEPISFYILLLG